MRPAPVSPPGYTSPRSTGEVTRGKVHTVCLPLNPDGSRPKYALVILDENTYRIFNWCRWRVHPSTMWNFARQAMLESARRIITEAERNGEAVPEEIVDLLEARG